MALKDLGPRLRPKSPKPSRQRPSPPRLQCPLCHHHGATGLDTGETATSSLRTVSPIELTPGVPAEMQPCATALRARRKPCLGPVMQPPPSLPAALWQGICLLGYTDIWWPSGLEGKTFMPGTESIQHKGTALNVCGTGYKSNPG